MDDDNDKALIYYVDNNYNSIFIKEINMFEYGGLIGFLASLFERFNDSDGYTLLHKNLAVYCDDSISEEQLEQIRHRIRCKGYSYTVLKYKDL